MSKRPSLVAALHEAGARPAQVPVPVPTAVPAVSQPVKEVAPASTRAPSRAGQRAVTTYVSPEAHAQLAMLAIERGQQLRRKVSTQELASEALNDLFVKYGRPSLS